MAWKEKNAPVSKIFNKKEEEGFIVTPIGRVGLSDQNSDLY